MAFGYDLTDVSAADMLKHKILIRQYILETDIHPFVTGVTFADVWRNRVRSKLGKTSANFASLDDLIQMKQAAGRPKDLEDVKALLALKERRARQR